MNQKYLELLYRSFDEKLTQDEEIELKNALNESEGLRQEKMSMVAMRSKIAESKTTSFKPFFAERLMARISSMEKETTSNAFLQSLVWAFKPALIAGLVVALVLVFLNLGSIDYSQLAGGQEKNITNIDEFVEETTNNLIEEAL